MCEYFFTFRNYTGYYFLTWVFCFVRRNILRFSSKNLREYRYERLQTLLFWFQIIITSHCPLGSYSSSAVIEILCQNFHWSNNSLDIKFWNRYLLFESFVFRNIGFQHHSSAYVTRFCFLHSVGILFIEKILRWPRYQIFRIQNVLLHTQPRAHTFSITKLSENKL